MTVTIIQAPAERHVENVVFGGYVEGTMMSLCGRWYGGEAQATVKRVRVSRIPAAAVCAGCVAIARRWYDPSYFEPFDTVQRQRLLDNLDRDLAVA